MTQFGKITIDDAVEITVQLGAESAALESSQTGKSRSKDLVNVIGDPQISASSYRWTAAAQQFSETYRWSLNDTLGQRQRSHPDTDDPTCSGMSLDPRQRRGAGQQEPAGIGTGINRSPYEVPALRHLLPLVDQNRGRSVEKSRGISESDAALRRVIKCMDRGGTPAGSSGLSNAFRTDDRYRRQGVS